MKQPVFQWKMALVVAVLMPIGQLLAQGQTKKATTKTTTTTPKPVVGELTVATPKTVEQTKSEVEALLKAGKSRADIVAAMKGKTSAKNLVISIRSGLGTPRPAGTNPQTPLPAEPAFSAADEADAIEMLRAMSGNGRETPNFEEMTAIQEVYEVPDLAAMLRVWGACFVIDKNAPNRQAGRIDARSPNGLAHLMGEWMTVGQGPQWKDQFSAFFDLYFQLGVSPQAFFYEFTQSTLEPKDLFNIPRGERIQQVLDAAIAHSSLTERQLLRTVLEGATYIGPTNSAAVRYRGFIQNVQPDFPQTATFWAEIMKMDNVANPNQGGVYPSVPMSAATDVLTAIFGATEAITAIRAVYQ